VRDISSLVERDHEINQFPEHPITTIWDADIAIKHARPDVHLAVRKAKGRPARIFDLFLTSVQLNARWT